MTSSYQRKLDEIGKARSSSKTAAKVRGIKWTRAQLSKMREMAAMEKFITAADLKNVFPNISDDKFILMLRKIRNLRKKLAKVTNIKANGVRRSVGEGVIYLIENEMFIGWVKCGMTVDLAKRLNTYNCNDPLKRFRLITERIVSDRRKAEKKLLELMKNNADIENGEWFRIDRNKALTVFNSI